MISFRERNILCGMFIFLLIFPAKALAYVDPGIGGLVFQAGYILLTGFSAAFLLFGKYIKRFFQKRKKSARND